jgi:ATP-dependent Clp protease ATP-binding subunit ClpC
MPEIDTPKVLSPGAQRLIETALEKQTAAKQEQTGVYHWLLALLERHGPMAEAMASGLKASEVAARLREQLAAGNIGAPLERAEVEKLAAERAAARGKDQASERDIAAVVLAADGYTLTETAPAARQSTPSVESDAADKSTPGAGSTPAASEYRSRVKKPTPALEQFGRDLTREAVEGKLLPVVGREAEIDLIIETLCRRTKRNPALVGPAGCGKTAIVEGLARRIAEGNVPEVLRGSRLLALQPSSLVAGAGMVGELDRRMQAVIAEAGQDGVLLFIDEIHSIVGAGGREGSGDVASQLKPALARGNMACLAATTDDEYRRFIEPDAALERRFQPIRVQEMTPAQTLLVLQTLRDELARLRDVQTGEGVLAWLVEFATQFLRNRTFPDKAVDLLEQGVAYAVTQGKTELTVEDAEAVARRMVGMPLAVEEQLQALQERLDERALLRDEDALSLQNRLAVTMRGLDLRSARPNAVVLLADDAAEVSEALGEAIAATLFGAAERVVAIDFGRMAQAHDVSLLIGAPPGYVGYSEALPLHRIAQMPWCVLRCENLHQCHPQVLAVLAQALEDGVITDARGKKIYLSDAVVLLTADVAAASGAAIGFRKSEAAAVEVRRDVLENKLGAELLAQCDLVVSRVPGIEVGRRRWLEKSLLQEWAGRYRKQDLHLQWDKSLVEWLMTQCDADSNQRDWERLVDESLSPLLLPYLATGKKESHSLLLKCEDGQVEVGATLAPPDSIQGEC